jgi:hypothetical protein
MPKAFSVEIAAVLEANIKNLEEQDENALVDNRVKHPRSFYDLPRMFNHDSLANAGTDELCRPNEELMYDRRQRLSLPLDVRMPVSC